MDTRRRRNSKQKGQSMVEYALVLVLVAVVAIAALSLVGPAVGRIFGVAVGAAGGQKNAAGSPPAGSSDVIYIWDAGSGVGVARCVADTILNKTSVWVPIEASADIDVNNIIITVDGQVTMTSATGSAAHILAEVPLSPTEADKGLCPKSVVVSAKHATAIAPVAVVVV